MNKLPKVIGVNLFCPLFIIKKRNNKGCKVYDIKTTDKMPIIDTKAIDLNAGCRANINTPMPVIVVIAESRIDVLYELRFFMPVLYSWSNPRMMKML